MNEADIYREWEPPPEWRHAVACLWEQRVGTERVQRVVPDGHADLLLHETGVVEVVGVQDRVALPVLSAGTRLFGVRLRPAAVAAAFRTPASSLVNRTLPAEDVVGVRLAPKTYQRVVRLQRFLREADAGRGLASAGADAGYADQAHLTRDVRQLTGLAPARLVAERRA